VTDRHGPAPDPETIARRIVEAFPDTDVVTAGGGTFFSCDPQTHWPNFATLVTTDEFDDASNLSRPGVFRLNIGLSRQRFDELVGSGSGQADEADVTAATTDYTALDRLLPHPVYARQHWISILNPSATTFDDVVWPLLEEAHDLLAGRAAKHLDRAQGEA
jgi:hypothetical protein